MHNKLAAGGFIISLVPVLLFLISLLPNATFLDAFEAWGIIYYLVLPVIAAILSVWALVKIKQTGDYKNKWAATSGTTLSILMILVWLISSFF